MTLNVTDLRVKLGRKEILHGVTLSAQPGEVTCIIGPNGSGKSTLLRALTGELQRTGQIDLNGRALGSYLPYELAPVRGVLQQFAEVAFPFTVREIIELGQNAGVNAKDPYLPDRMLQEVDLAGYGERPYHELSGGEQQRVQLARALAQVARPGVSGHAEQGPRWLFLDEPVSSLDIKHQHTVMDRMRRFAREGGGVVAVMHDLNLTAMVADQVLVMKEGEISIAGNVQATYVPEVLSQAYDYPVFPNRLAPRDLHFVLPQAWV